MRFKVAINGYGRIGQSVLRALYSSPYRSRFSILNLNIGHSKKLTPTSGISALVITLSS